ncbi:DUF1768 domain-containing protein [Spartobacteria bacterium LR76]|nr:DUF1768 domain-containing protein [Spartobacteria bacterium LR76]
MEAATVCFYKPNEAFGLLTNFARLPIEVDGKVWPTTEHYFQAQKFHDEAYRERIRTAETPREAADLGRSRNVPLRPDWEAIKDDVMRRAIAEKVRQHQAVQDVLLSTGDSLLVEHTPRDSYWGDGGDGSGKNMLGKILMEVRRKLRSGEL